ncbi:HDOD domain-containing protein [Ideonella dechloratans]|uniref:HDOD domain-containing protein n=1 Tax=Ideonella dechloratans TaxID=36863 RepID=UPI0035AE3316
MSSAPSPSHYPSDLGSWVRYFQLVEIPVLPHTAAVLEELRQMQDEVDARMLADELMSDPLMTLKVLAYTATVQRHRRNNDAETLREALVLTGITPFFATFGPQPTVDAHLEGQPEALAGLQAVLDRADRAGRFALAFALHRRDHDAAVIYLAALLHDFAEMLLWLNAPTLALQMKLLQQADRTLRSTTVQRQCLHVTLGEVQQALMQTWHLPELLVHITDDRKENDPQVRNVLLAVRLARHTSLGWDNPAVPDDVSDIARLLTMAPEATLNWLKELDG